MVFQTTQYEFHHSKHIDAIPETHISITPLDQIWNHNQFVFFFAHLLRYKTIYRWVVFKGQKLYANVWLWQQAGWLNSSRVDDNDRELTIEHKTLLPDVFSHFQTKELQKHADIHNPGLRTRFVWINKRHKQNNHQNHTHFYTYWRGVTHETCYDQNSGEITLFCQNWALSFFNLWKVCVWLCFTINIWKKTTNDLFDWRYDILFPRKFTYIHLWPFQSNWFMRVLLYVSKNFFSFFRCFLVFSILPTFSVVWVASA